MWSAPSSGAVARRDSRTRSTKSRAPSKPDARYTAPMIASMASARIDGFIRPPESSSPLPSRRCSPTREVLGHAGQGDRAHDGLADLGEVALVEVGVLAVHVVGDDDAEDGVAQELEALVRRVARVLRAPRAVHERGRERGRARGRGRGVRRGGPGPVPGGRSWPLQPADDVVDGVAHRLQVLEVLVVDAEPDACAR